MKFDQQLTVRIRRAIDERVFPGCVVGIVRRGGERLVLPMGKFTYESSAAPMQETTVFDVASITKAIPVSCVALRLMADGRLRLDGKVSDYVAGFSNAFRDQVTIFHLLTHTLEFAGRLSAHKDLPPADLLRAIVTQELTSAPGAGYSYSNTASILLGMVIERAVNQPLPQVADQLFFKPMRMFRTTFFPEHIEKSSVAPTELDPWRGRTLQAEVHDESAWALRRIMVAGSAGLFSTVPDLLVFVRMLLNSGEHAGARVLEPETVRLMHTNQLEHIGRSAGLGWELFQPRFMGSHCTPHTFGKTGFTGCSVIIEPEAGFGFVLLSNCTFPQRRPDRTMIDEVRSECADILFAGLE